MSKNTSDAAVSSHSSSISSPSGISLPSKIDSTLSDSKTKPRTLIVKKKKRRKLKFKKLKVKSKKNISPKK
jgi:hypothetical protein